MRSAFRLLLASLACAGACAGASLPAARAQAPPAPPVDGPRYAITYLEVMPTATTDGLKLVRQFRNLVRTETGNLRAEALQRMGFARQFVLLDVWKDQGAADAHAKAATTMEFRERIKAIQTAPIDQRLHFPLAVGPLAAGPKASAIVVVTHIDVVPPQRESGTAITQQLADDSRGDDGNLRFEAVTQLTRQNHFSVIEMWRDRRAVDAHSVAAHTRAFRDRLAPAIGALYDERYYALVR